MKHLWSFALALLLASPALADPPMHDYSLSVEETFKQPNINNNPTTFGIPNQPGSIPGLVPTVNTYSNTSPAREPSAQTARFMDSYCDPNFQPVSRGAVPACMAANKQKACSIFNRMPVDVQQILEQSISCISTISETDGSTITTASADPNCMKDDHRRLVLLQKYWGQQDPSYALLFLPDLVLSGGDCTRGER